MSYRVSFFVEININSMHSRWWTLHAIPTTVTDALIKIVTWWTSLTQRRFHVGWEYLGREIRGASWDYPRIKSLLTSITTPVRRARYWNSVVVSRSGNQALYGVHLFAVSYEYVPVNLFGALHLLMKYCCCRVYHITKIEWELLGCIFCIGSYLIFAVDRWLLLYKCIVFLEKYVLAL
jgi:hypothetical protein